MGVANDADALDAIENTFELVGVVRGIFRKDVFVDGLARRAVYGEQLPHGSGGAAHGLRAVGTDVFGDAHFEVIEKLVARGLFGFVGFGLKLFARPMRCEFGVGVEVGGLVKHGEIVVAQQAPGAPCPHDVDAFERVRAVADGVAKTDDALDAARVDICQHSFECDGVGVNITDDRGGHRGGF